MMLGLYKIYSTQVCQKYQFSVFWNIHDFISGIKQTILTRLMNLNLATKRPNKSKQVWFPKNSYNVFQFSAIKPY